MFYDNYALKTLLVCVLAGILFLLVVEVFNDFQESQKQEKEKENILYSYTVGGASRSGVIVQAICNRKTDKCLCFNENTMEAFPCPE